ncbi:MAG: potassium channel protein [Armatimonadota bacterium]
MILSTFKRLRLALLALLALVALGTIGYKLIEGWSTLNALYMTVITLATVGYKEVAPLSPPGKVFTIILISFGVSIVFWAVASLFEIVISEQLWHTLLRRRMENQINKLQDHYIICGYGRMGQEIAKVFSNSKVPYAVVEINPEQLPKLIEQNIPFIEGNASDDKVLLAAGIKRAKGLVTVAASDEENVFITLTARGLSPDLFIVARSIREENEDKLKRAGANKVMSPYISGGRRMAFAALRPQVLEFLDAAIRADDITFELDDVNVTSKSPFVGKRINESRIRETSGAMILAVRSSNGTLNYNPNPNTVLIDGDTLILVGTPAELNTAQAYAAGHN